MHHSHVLQIYPWPDGYSSPRLKRVSTSRSSPSFRTFATRQHEVRLTRLDVRVCFSSTFDLPFILSPPSLVIMARSLSHLIDEVPPTIPQSVPDSCGEESSDDDIQPKPLSGARIVPSSSRGPSSSKLGPRGSSGQLHGVRVEQVVGRGGKLVYQAVRDEGAAKYFTVQW